VNRIPGGGAVKRLVLETVGWILVLGGIAALVLPGPGLLMLFAGMVILSRQYTWAERRLRPVERQAKKTAADSVQTWPRILASLTLSLWLVAVGIVFFIHPPAPSWWPVDEQWWLPGGVLAGATLVASGLLALGMIVYSFRHYRGLDEAEIERQVEETVGPEDETGSEESDGLAEGSWGEPSRGRSR